MVELTNSGPAPQTSQGFKVETLASNLHRMVVRAKNRHGNQGGATVFLAMGDGKRAAAAIDRCLTSPSA